MKAVVFTGWKHILNLAAIIRTADGLGFDEVIVLGRKKVKGKFCKKALKDWLEYKPKLIQLDTTNEIKKYLVKKNYSIVSMELDDEAIPLENFEWSKDVAILVGHENSGVPKDLRDISTKVMLNMKGEVKCMNVACAASIAMYDYH